MRRSRLGGIEGPAPAPNSASKLGRTQTVLPTPLPIVPELVSSGLPELGRRLGDGRSLTPAWPALLAVPCRPSPFRPAKARRRGHPRPGGRPLRFLPANPPRSVGVTPLRKRGSRAPGKPRARATIQPLNRAPVPQFRSEFPAVPHGPSRRHPRVAILGSRPGPSRARNRRPICVECPRVRPPRPAHGAGGGDGWALVGIDGASVPPTGLAANPRTCIRGLLVRCDAQPQRTADTSRLVPK